MKRNGVKNLNGFRGPVLEAMSGNIWVYDSDRAVKDGSIAAMITIAKRDEKICPPREFIFPLSRLKGRV